MKIMNEEPRLQRMPATAGKLSNNHALKTRKGKHGYYARLTRHSFVLFSCLPAFLIRFFT